MPGPGPRRSHPTCRQARTRLSPGTATGATAPTPPDQPASPAAAPVLLLPMPAAVASPRVRAASTDLRKLVRHGLGVQLNGLAGTHARLQLWITPSTARRLGLRARRTLLGAADVHVTNGSAHETVRIARRFRGRLATQSPVAFSLILTTAGKSYGLPLVIRR